MITDAQFIQWLKSGSAQIVVLAEPRYGYQRSGAPAEGIYYWADKPFKTKPHLGDVENIAYADVIDTAPDFERGIDTSGRGLTSVGSLGLSNADGVLDGLLDSIMDGRACPFYIGDMRWPRLDFRLVNTAIVLTIKSDSDEKMSVQLRDQNLLLDTTIIGDPILTGPNTGKPKPILFGYVLNLDITGYLIDPGLLIYALNSYAMSDFTKVVDVRDSGISLQGTPFEADNTTMTVDIGTDIITRSAHGLVANDIVYFSGEIFAGLEQITQYWVVAADLTANTFKVSRTQNGTPEDITGTTFSGTVSVYKRRWLVDVGAATIQLVSKPIGQVTADIRSAGASGNALLQGIPHVGFQYILDNYTELTAADRDQAAFDALVADEVFDQLLWGYAVLDRMNVIDVLDEIAVLTNSWYSWKADGTLTVGKLDLPSLDDAAVVDTIRQGDIEGEPECENLPIEFGKIIMDARRNVTVQSSGLSAGVSAANMSLWTQGFQLRVKTTDPGLSTYSEGWWRYHKTAIDSSPLETSLYAQTAQAQHIVDEKTALYRPWTRIFRCKVGLDKYMRNPGDAVLSVYPRYSMNAGLKFRVASVKALLTERAVELVLIRQSTPDYLRASSFTKPDPPTDVLAVAGNTLATVTFEPPIADGGSPILEYIVTASPGGAIAKSSLTSIVVGGLTNGTPYTFTVTATNAIGTSLPSAPSNSAMPDITRYAPQPPIIGAPTRGNAQISIVFTPPVDNGGSAILDYTATAVKSPPDAVPLVSVTGAGSPLVVTGLVNGQNYTVKVRARNAIGNSPYSGDSAVAKPATVPSAPAKPGISAGNGNVSVSYVAPNTGGEPITQYTINVYRVSDNVLVGTGTSTTLNKSITGLTNGVAVYAKVLATNVIGNSPLSVVSNNATPDVSLNPPNTPAAPSVTPGNGSVFVDFAAPSDGGSPILDYTISTYLSGSFVKSNTTSGATPTDYTVTGLTNGLTYTFKVRARNAVGSSADSASSASVTPATVPNASGAVISAVAGNGQATITIGGSWSNGGSVCTQVQAKSTPGNITANFSNPGNLGPFGGSVVMTGLTNGVQYTFKVTPTNAIGVGTPTANSNSVTPSAPVHTVTAGDIDAWSMEPSYASGGSSASISGGVGPFTFSWAFIAGGTGITLSGATLQSVTARTTSNTPQFRQGTLRVTVTDAGNSNLQVTKDISVALTVESNL